MTRKINTIQLTRAQRQKLYGIRRRADPHEGCALLLGIFREEEDTAVVIQVVEMENIAQSSASFAIDPEQQYRILTTASLNNLDLVAIFHSHPAPPRPSGHDLEFMAYNPCAWIIDGLLRDGRHAMRAYQFIEEQLHEVTIRIRG
ncbi:MAG: M67 family metallopeptidase [Promethearchaeota archaeon]